jgi:hypothetical protein
MDAVNTTALREQLARTVGPSPWYWSAFPAVTTASRRFIWNHHGKRGTLAHLVSLAPEDDSEHALLALNTYCRPFLVPPDHLGIWCPEGRSLRFTCFDPEHMKPFDLAEVAGWFKQSSDRIYAATEPLCDFEAPVSMEAGTHKLEVPPQLQEIKELIAPTTCRALGNDDPAMALFVFYFHAGLVEVLPQRWFTAAQYQVGKQWITRAARDTDSHRIFGECFGAGSFLLEEDGVRLERWMQKTEA